MVPGAICAIPTCKDTERGAVLNRILFFLFVAISLNCYAGSPNIIEFNIKSNNKKNTIDCKASLLKFKSSCALITERQCIPNNSYTTYVILEGKSLKTQPLNLKQKINIIALTVPTAIDRLYCKRSKTLPEEGVVFKGDQTKVLLGLMIHNPRYGTYYEQIDNKHDYHKKCEECDNRSFKPFSMQITRKVDDYPNLQLRKEILERLAGEYANRYYTITRSHNITFKKSTHSIEGKSIIEPTVVINSDQKTIFLDVPSHKKVYKVSFSKDYKTVYLHDQDNNKLMCDNRNLLKLICRNQNTELNLSLDSSLNKNLRFKYALETEDSLINYSFGYLRGSDGQKYKGVKGKTLYGNKD